METVLIVGASGNIGVAATIAALRSKRHVLAIVRNKASEEKLFQHVGTKEGITIAEADVTSEDGVQKVVDRVRDGELPSFQHVFSALGMLNSTTPIQNLSTLAFRQVMNVNVEATFFAYRATIPYLIAQGNPSSTWTLITGGAGEYGSMGATAMAQGALFSLANVAIRENTRTNIRANEIYLNTRVDYDDVVEKKGDLWRVRASEFGRVYEAVLANREIDACRVSVLGKDDLEDLKYEKKLPVV